MLIQKSELKEIWKSLGKRKLEELKQEIIAILKKQEEKDYKKAIEQFSKEEKKYKYLEKSISGEWIEKAGYGIGTVRIWKGKKYKKIAPGKWARMYEKEGRGTNIAVGHLIAKVKKIDDVEELMNFVMQNKQRFQDENGMDLPILDKIRAEVDRQSGKIESKGKTSKTNESESRTKQGEKDYLEGNWGDPKNDIPFFLKKEFGNVDGKKTTHFETRNGQKYDVLNEKSGIYEIERTSTTGAKSRFLVETMGVGRGFHVEKIEEKTKKQDEKYTDNAKFVKEVKGDVWEEWNTDPNKFAVIYDKNTGKSKGLRMTQDIVDIINSVVEPSVLDWQDNVAEKVHEKYPEIKESYIKENIKQIRMGYRNGSQEKIQILNKESEAEKTQNRSTGSDSSSFKLSDIYDRNVHDEMKQVQSFDEAKNVIKQIADNYGPTEKGRKLLENFMSYNVGGSSPIYDKVYEHFGISYNDLDADFDAAKNKILKLASGQKNVSKEEKQIQQGKDDFASRYRNAIEQEDKNFQKKENSKNIQNQMTPKQQKTFDDFEKKAIKNAGNTDRGKRFAKHNYNIDGEDWTITTDGRVMLCSREKFEEPTKTDKITNMDKVFVINGQKESAIPDGIDAIIKAAPKKVVVGKDYKGKDEKKNAIVKIGDRYFSVEHLKTIQNFLGPLSNAKMQVIPDDNKSRVKFESGNKAVVLMPIEHGAELENRIINTNDIKKSLEDIIMFCNDFEDEDEVIEEIKNESLFSDYSAENPELFNSIAFKVEEVLNECGICGL